MTHLTREEIYHEDLQDIADEVIMTFINDDEKLKEDYEETETPALDLLIEDGLLYYIKEEIYRRVEELNLECPELDDTLSNDIK